MQFPVLNTDRTAMECGSILMISLLLSNDQLNQDTRNGNSLENRKDEQTGVLGGEIANLHGGRGISG